MVEKICLTEEEIRDAFRDFYSDQAEKIVDRIKNQALRLDAIKKV